MLCIRWQRWVGNFSLSHNTRTQWGSSGVAGAGKVEDKQKKVLLHAKYSQIMELTPTRGNGGYQFWWL